MRRPHHDIGAAGTEPAEFHSRGVDYHVRGIVIVLSLVLLISAAAPPFAVGVDPRGFGKSEVDAPEICAALVGLVGERSGDRHRGIGDTDIIRPKARIPAVGENESRPSVHAE